MLLCVQYNRRFNIDGEWFQFGRKQGINFAEFEKLVAPEISKGGNFAYDKKGEFYSTTTIYGYIKKNEISESYKCLLAILNSQLVWWYLVNTGTVLANGYFRFKPNYLNPFPMPKTVTSEIQLELELLVDKIIIATANKENSLIEELRIKIDLLIYKLYNLTDEEIEIILKT